MGHVMVLVLGWCDQCLCSGVCVWADDAKRRPCWDTSDVGCRMFVAGVVLGALGDGCGEKWSGL